MPFEHLDDRVILTHPKVHNLYMCYVYYMRTTGSKRRNTVIWRNSHIVEVFKWQRSYTSRASIRFIEG